MQRIEGDLITFEWNGMEIINPTVSECGRFACSPKRYGFTVIDTGGGCTAWAKELPNGEYLLVTRYDEPDHDIREGEEATIGRYNGAGEMLACWYFTVGVGLSRGEIEGY